MPDDPLNTEISVSAELTPTGVKASAKSRILAAVDWLGGNLVLAIGARLDRRIQHDRVVDEADRKFVARLGELRLEHLDGDPNFAAEAIAQHLKTIVRRQENKAAVVTLALEDLRSDPPSEEQNHSGPETLTDEFMGRIERYAEDATDHDVRERWAKVLASEVRQPGTFSARVLRVIDEIDPATAILFDTICQARIGNAIMPCLLNRLTFIEQSRLVSSELLVDIGLGGQLRVAAPTTLSDGRDVQIIGLGEAGAIGFDRSIKLPLRALGLMPDPDFPIMVSDQKAQLLVYTLTDVGHAISSIIKHDEKVVFDRLVQRIASSVKPNVVLEFGRHESEGYALKKVWNDDREKKHEGSERAL